MSATKPKLTPFERRKIGQAAQALRKTSGAGPGRPRKVDRCPCGLMTKARAEARRHKCKAPEATA